MSRNPYIDRLRGLAILLVLCGHSVTYGGFWILSFPNRLQKQIVYDSYWGVSIFFAISGYLITSELISGISPSHRVDLMAFYVKRVGRILPPLLTLIVLGFSFAVAGGHALRLDEVYSAAFYVATFDAISIAKFTPGIGDGYTILWSLAVEEKFYLLFPLLVTAIRSPRGLIAVLLVTMVYELAAKAMGVGSFEDITTFGQIGIGCLGAVVIPQLRVRFVRHLRLIRWAGSTALGVCLLTLDWGAALGPFLVGLATVVTVTGCPHRHERSVLPFRILERFGQLSYEIYLIHKMVFIATAQLTSTSRSGEYTAAVDWAIYLVRLSVIYGLSAAFAALISVPANRFIRSAYARHRRPAFHDPSALDGRRDGFPAGAN